MKAMHYVEDWGSRHHPAVADVLRVLLGAFLLAKGYTFLQNMAYLKWILSNHDLAGLPSGLMSFLMFYVIFVHMTGGTLIMLGISTRIASLLQLPIIAAAIFVINNFRSPLNTELWLSVVSGVLLLVFLVIGSGPFSLDHYLTETNKD
jgi:putative oxidoreductase